MSSVGAVSTKMWLLGLLQNAREQLSRAGETAVGGDSAENVESVVNAELARVDSAIKLVKQGPDEPLVSKRGGWRVTRVARS